MSVQAEFKVIYGYSFPNFNPGSAGYGGYYKTLSNILDFTASTPDMSGVGSLNTFIESINLSFPTTYVQSTYGSTYIISINYTTPQNSPYIYMNLNNGGPVASTDFCLDTNTFLECRAYNTYINVLVFRLKSTSTNNFTLSRASIQYPSSQYSDSTKYNINAYVTNSDNQYVYSGSILHTKANLLPLAPTLTIYNDIYGSNKAGYRTNILITYSMSSQTLYNNYKTGSMTVITFGNLTTIYGSSCLASVRNDINARLVCIVSTNTITVTSASSDYTPLDLITITIGITNPNGAVSFNLVHYSKYINGSLYWKVIDTTAVYSVDTTETATALAKSLMYMYPVRSRISTVANSPFRFWLKFPAAAGSLTTANGAYHQLSHTQIGSSSNFECYFI
jgi:hypothetical protein